MKRDNIVLLEYQNSFADNFSNIAYAKLLEENFGTKYYFENNISKRKDFDSKMAEFKCNLNFISSVRIQNFNKRNIVKSLNISSKLQHDAILDINRFKISDIKYLNNSTKSMFDFANKDFIVNHDILENILSCQSVGLFIHDSDINCIDNNYIYEATKRLNKYLINPKLFIFAPKSLKNKIYSYIDYEIYSFYDWREVFYFLTSCRHKIILNSDNSYSEGFWAAVLGQNFYSINIYSKKYDLSKPYHNWLGI